MSPPADRDAPAPSGLDEPVRVLHVDDDPQQLDLTADLLEGEHRLISVRSVETAEAALEALEPGEFDCVVSDYDMPGMDGLELLGAVRDRHGGLPFVLFTGKGSEEIASEAISAGVSDYLQKGPGIQQFEIMANRIESHVERRRTEAALAESRRQLSTLLDNLPGLAYRCGNEPAWPMEFVSDGSEDLAGYRPEALESGRVEWGEDVIHPDDRESVWEEVQSALAAEEPFRLTYRIRHADGGIRWVWEQGVDVRDGGDLVALEGFITDVTERRRLRDEARETGRRFEAVVEASPEPIIALDVAGNVTLWNQAAEEAFGWPAEDVLGERLPFVTQATAGEHRALFERAISGESVTDVELVRVDAEGEPVSFELSTAPLTDDDGEVVGVMCVASVSGDSA